MFRVTTKTKNNKTKSTKHNQNTTTFPAVSRILFLPTLLHDPTRGSDAAEAAGTVEGTHSELPHEAQTENPGGPRVSALEERCHRPQARQRRHRRYLQRPRGLWTRRMARRGKDLLPDFVAHAGGAGDRRLRVGLVDREHWRDLYTLRAPFRRGCFRDLL